LLISFSFNFTRNKSSLQQGRLYCLFAEKKLGLVAAPCRNRHVADCKKKPGCQLSWWKDIRQPGCLSKTLWAFRPTFAGG